MTTVMPRPAIAFRPAALRRYVRSPKGTVLLLFLGLFVLAAPAVGLQAAMRSVLVPSLTAGAMDLVLLRYIRGTWSIPTAAVLTGMIIGFVLAPQAPMPVAVATAAIAIAGKHLLRTRLANVFNPAALALVAAGIFFSAGQSWWGALPDTSFFGPLLLISIGLFIVDRIKKLPLVFSFLGAYFALFTVSCFFGNAASAAEIFRSPDIEAALFFAFFMVDDPPTCPIRPWEQVVCGVIVATAAWGIFVFNGALYFLPAGLLVGNAYAGASRAIREQLRARKRNGRGASGGSLA